MILTLVAAHAAPLVEVGAGTHFVPGPPDARGAQLGGDVVLRVDPVFAITAAIWGQAAATPAAWDVNRAYESTLSRVQGGATVLADFSPLSGTMVGQPFWVDVGVGPGLVHTLDDLVALQCGTGDACDASERQWRPALAWAVGPRIGLSDRAGLRLQARGQHWLETLQGTDIRRQAQLAVGAGLLVRLGPVARAPDPSFD